MLGSGRAWPLFAVRCIVLITASSFFGCPRRGGGADSRSAALDNTAAMSPHQRGHQDCCLSWPAAKSRSHGAARLGGRRDRCFVNAGVSARRGGRLSSLTACATRVRRALRPAPRLPSNRRWSPGPQTTQYPLETHTLRVGRRDSKRGRSQRRPSRRREARKALAWSLSPRVPRPLSDVGGGQNVKAFTWLLDDEQESIARVAGQALDTPHFARQVNCRSVICPTGGQLPVVEVE